MYLSAVFLLFATGISSSLEPSTDASLQSVAPIATPTIPLEPDFCYGTPENDTSVENAIKEVENVLTSVKLATSDNIEELENQAEAAVAQATSLADGLPFDAEGQQIIYDFLSEWGWNLVDFLKGLSSPVSDLDQAKANILDYALYYVSKNFFSNYAFGYCYGCGNVRQRNKDIRQIVCAIERAAGTLGLSPEGINENEQCGRDYLYSVCYDAPTITIPAVSSTGVVSSSAASIEIQSSSQIVTSVVATQSSVQPLSTGGDNFGSWNGDFGSYTLSVEGTGVPSASSVAQSSTTPKLSTAVFSTNSDTQSSAVPSLTAYNSASSIVTAQSSEVVASSLSSLAAVSSEAAQPSQAVGSSAQASALPSASVTSAQNSVLPASSGVSVSGSSPLAVKSTSSNQASETEGGSVTTTVVTAFTTYCPEPTTFCVGDGKCYTATEATTMTVTDCPCTLTTTCSNEEQPTAANTFATPTKSLLPVSPTNTVPVVAPIAPESQAPSVAPANVGSAALPQSLAVVIGAVILICM